MAKWLSSVVIVGGGLAILLAALIPTAQDRLPKPTDRKLFPSELHDKSPLGDRVFAVHADGPQYVFGRWKEPLETLQFHLDDDWQLALRSAFTTKYWHYNSVSTDQFFIGAAIVKLGYVSDAFLYVVDKTTSKMEKFEFTGRLPGNLGLTFASSSLDTKTCTSFTALGGEKMMFCYNSEAQEWRIQANVTTTGAIGGESRRFLADLQLAREEALTILFPVGNDALRPAYVHKGAGSPVRGSFQLGDVIVDLSKTSALGAIDWTRSQALRCTRWNWASSSFKAKVMTVREGEDPINDEEALVGINFSKHVYDIDGESQENAIWINGKVYILRGVEFAVPTKSPTQDEWLIESASTTSSDSVRLRFTPSGGSREDHTHLLIIESDFVQPYGTFNGEISLTTEDGTTRISVEVANAFGVVEDHFALW